MRNDDGVDYRPRLLPEFERQARLNNEARAKKREQKIPRNLNIENKNLMLSHLSTELLNSDIDFFIHVMEGLKRFENFFRTDQRYVAAFDRRVEMFALKNGLKNEPNPAQYARIERRLCAVFHVTPKEIRSHRRKKEIMLARQAVMYWAVRLTGYSYPKIGRIMGGRDHTSIISGATAYRQKREKMGRYLRKAR